MTETTARPWRRATVGLVLLAAAAAASYGPSMLLADATLAAALACCVSAMIADHDDT